MDTPSVVGMTHGSPMSGLVYRSGGRGGSGRVAQVHGPSSVG